MKSFLQTEDWLNFQRSIGRPVWRFDDGKIVANIVRHDIPFRKNYLYIPHGPAVDWNSIEGSFNHELNHFISYVKNLAREQKSIFVKMEPLDDKVPEQLHHLPRGGGIRKSKKEINPAKTVILELGKNEEELLAAMHHKTRYNIKVAEKNNVIIEESDEIEIFYKMLKKTSGRQKFSTHGKGYYEKLFEFFKSGKEIKSNLRVVKYENRPIAAALLLNYQDVCYYLHGGSDYEYRNVMAPHALHWSIVKEMNSRGIKFYDFGGSEGSKWPGITRFKLSWGGRQVEYPGSFDLPVRRFWFFVYNVARKIL
ncbi:MAG: Methicillin resistance protein [Candidatus Yanofskybacteria bacterium GW2011_GWA1_48_10]|uniref:Methicillin resistance protein n=3 Tax=Parcubacteria group TaxID=1794811 RepID=A0A0G1U7F6_9BACT|nr:MAG: Methicillin resistance protein [Candidatus Nomurabacteria bacterium GW2011_GWB1_47_6]KKU90054.1 MAG: Methicillin resistance protein [Candidatus Yanofskybacteria bacterium GW2011_GWA1_48_10]OGN05970.1 MAG: hypothetical protein A2669_01215 [Candidatus Yanofskybacteria bacterium RIFCSPHIGHO2_01_FULL_48_25b]